MERPPEAHLQLALKAGKIGTWELVLPGRILTASHQCKANFGRAPGNLFTYDDLHGAIHPADRHLLEAAVQMACHGGQEFVVEYRCYWPDGSLHWISVSGLALFDSSGEARKLTGITQEITTRKIAETELRDARRRITSMLDAVDVAAWTLDLISDRVTPDRNLTKIFYLTDEEAHGSVENYLRRIHSADRPVVEAAMQRVFADPTEKYALEYRVVSPAGELRWIDIRGDVERDSNGKPIFFRGVVIDITRRKNIEALEKQSTQQVQQAVERFRKLADAMPQMVWSGQPDGSIDYFNQRWFDYTGLSFAESQGWGWKQTQHPEDLPGTLEKWARCLGDLSVFENEMRFLRASDHSWRWHFTRAVPVFDADGLVLQWVGTCTDIHDRKEAEEALRTSQQRLEASVIERTTELWQEVNERRKAEYELRQLSGRLLTLKDEEQRRIARELHDSVGQYLAAASMSFGAASRQMESSGPAKDSLTEGIALLQDAIKEVRVVSYLLHPPLLDEMGLVSALEFYLEGFSQRSGIRAKLIVDEDFGRLPMELETALFRACQECITNVHRHSGSATAKVRLTRFPDRVQLEVEDEGRGMPIAKFSGVGLRGLRERIAQFSGTTNIRSGSTGTIVVAELPLVAVPSAS